jgi:gluconolactonase
MRIPVSVIGLACVVACGGNSGSTPQSSETFESIGVIERFEPEFDRLVPASARIEKLAEGFSWSEGPVWVPSGAYLLFSDIPRNVVFRWKEGEGLSEFLRPSGYTGPSEPGREPGSNGLALDPRGRLVLCQHGDRRLVRLREDGTFEELVSSFEGKRFNSPNDLVFASNGDLFFTDPPYGLTGLNESPLKELPFNGVFRLSAEGNLSLLTAELTFPNGVALSPDEGTLYVAVSDPANPVLMAYPLLEDRTLGEGRVLFDFSPWAQLPGLPDGLKVDEAGNIFCTGPGGVSVLSPEGRLLGRFNTGVATANCAWGDDGSALYITADSYLCRVRLTTRGSVGTSGTEGRVHP